MTLAKFLALDFGAGSGRAILGKISDTITLEDLHRFHNPQVKIFDHYYWDLPFLFNELKKGLAEAGRRGHRDLAGIGVDTWGVDFGLIGDNQTLLGNPVTYRDRRTEGMMELAFRRIPQKAIYELTGIQFMSFNSIYQIFSLVQHSNPLLDVARQLLFMPDLFTFLMSGEMVSEYSIASTSQLLNAREKRWEATLFHVLDLPLEIMAPLVEPGTVVGKLLPDLSAQVDLGGIDVIASASHDTASAVAAVPVLGDDWAYLSSGTWSLIGIETEHPLISAASFENGFTNEGGVAKTIRFLKNVMGMWLFERCRSQWEREGNRLTYEALLDLAKDAKPFRCVINPDDASFLNPPDMPRAIGEFCRKTGQAAPESKGEYVRCILESLAFKYKYVLENLQKLRQKPLQTLHIVGGGSQNTLLNQFTANATGLHVVAGPVEATALGNIIVQAIAKKVLSSLSEGRELIRKSFELHYVMPRDQTLWNQVYEHNKHLFQSSTF